ncbi:hypothetical protein DCAR_0207899 [Daucus carota subsp. sativus]|uniref:Uncharacterized protein n=1 Tax=Daucus carota subsp. sativus TaxID=79200 RepID=A0AAF1AMI0_DAUCS|nr:hypothetical protein DCAR_0207899 [Daucus carota subsp. sativus]
MLFKKMTLKQLQNLSPPIVKQALPLFEQLPSLYMELVNGRDNFIPKPEETQRLVLGSGSISSMLDMSIRLLPGDHVLPLQQALPDVPPTMVDAVNRGGEFLANLTAGTPWEPATKDVANALGVESTILRAGISKDLDMLVDVIISWINFNMGKKQLSD